MARQPIPGQDRGSWGTILNEYLSVSLDAGGALKPVTEDKLDTSVQTKLDAVSTKVATGGPAATSGAVFWGVWHEGDDPTPPNDGKVHWGFRIVD